MRRPARKKKAATARAAARHVPRKLLLTIAFMPRSLIMALAAVVEVAVHKEERLLTNQELSQRYGFQPRYFEPVLQALVRNRILDSTRGPRGGYVLARKPGRIMLQDVLLATAAVDKADTTVRSTLYTRANVMRAMGKLQRAISGPLARISIDTLTRSAAR
jgi:Rrf2 family protein